MKPSFNHSESSRLKPTQLPPLRVREVAVKGSLVVDQSWVIHSERNLTPFLSRNQTVGETEAASDSSSTATTPTPAKKNRTRIFSWLLALIIFVAFGTTHAHAQAAAPSGINLNIGLGGVGATNDVDGAIKVLAIMTLLTLAPSIILLMTCFTRIVIVLSFVRSALSLQGTPSNQIIIGLSLFLTFFIMSPVWEKIDRDALTPYRAKEISSEVAMERATVPIRNFMLKQTRPKDVELFVALAKIGPTPANELPLKIVIPSFIISELRTAFQMGFLVFIPFILIDLVVATVLMSMGMMMMPPMTISLPLKILLFVLVDGWHLIVSSIVQSFGT
ncbi:MAG TPA: flagellar type III secretion system pore protein FliP [Verrucomicrobiae bacterium]|jgi:flagellar biosynthetic protein FliP|nr:flagellar type III secretion system pore protein FliP [Verrucomicrobiae bacterium]